MTDGLTFRVGGLLLVALALPRLAGAVLGGLAREQARTDDSAAAG